jgi:hypothetical protein
MKVNPTTKFFGRRLKTFSAPRDSSIDWRMNSEEDPRPKCLRLTDSDVANPQLFIGIQSTSADLSMAAAALYSGR